MCDVEDFDSSMRYLARVLKKAFLHGAELELLARQITDLAWEQLSTAKLVKTSKIVAFNEGTLVLVEIPQLPPSSTGLNTAPDQAAETSSLDDEVIVTINDATDWVLDLISTYLARGMTPELLAQEVERAEQWRQSLTLQSQEVGRRALETAARRDEIQELEKNLKFEQEVIARREAELSNKEQQLNSLTEGLQNQDVGRFALETAAHRDELEGLEKHLKLARDSVAQKETALRTREVELNALTQSLAQRETALNTRETELNALAESLAQRESDLDTQD